MHGHRQQAVSNTQYAVREAHALVKASREALQLSQKMIDDARALVESRRAAAALRMVPGGRPAGTTERG